MKLRSIPGSIRPGSEGERRSTFLPFARRLLPRATCSNYSSPNCKTSLERNSADYRNGSSKSAMNSTTSPQNQRTLAGQLRSSVDYEEAWRAVKDQDERPKPGALDSSPRHPGGYHVVGEKK